MMHLSLTDARYLALHEGQRPIPGYCLIRCRGRGGFGEVWEAEGPGGFRVALKFVRLASSGQAAELRALDFIRGVHHPNLLANFGSWLVEGTLIVGMELADRSLWDRYVEATQQGYRGIPREELLGSMGEVAAGVDYLNGYRHTFEGRTRIGIQHRDLKPPNILLFGGGAKVADLGMARVMEGEVAGHTGNWTFPYAAPEFFRGETTHQSDQYGLAATYCQLRGGHLPFSGSAAAVTAGHLFARPNLDALPELERPIVERALAKVPGDRWPSCRAFVAALRALPAADVAETLIDLEGSSAVRHGLPSSEPFLSNDPGGFPSSGSGLIDPRWLQNSLSSGSLFDAALAHPPSPPASSPPAAGAPRSADLVPTRIFPATAAMPSLADAPARPGRVVGRVLATMATALVLVAVAIQAPGSSRSPSAAPVRPDGPPPRTVAPIPVPSSDAAATIAEPVPPVPISGTAEVARRDEPGSEPVDPGPAPVRTSAAAEAPVVVVAPARDQAPDPEPVATAVDHADPVLEGPIGMAVLAPRATALDPAGRVVSLRAGESTIAPPETNVPSVVANSPVPEPDSPEPAASRRAIAPAAAPVADAARSPALARSVAPEPTRLSPAEAAFARGRGLFLRNSFAQAATEFGDSVRLNPGHTTSYLLRAISRHRAGDPKAALTDYAEVIRARPDDVTAYVSRGQAYHELGSYDRAIADYTEALRRRPGDSDAHFRRGLAQFKSSNYGGAIDDFSATLRLNPQNAYAAEFRAEALARRGAKPGWVAPAAGALIPSSLPEPLPTDAAPAAPGQAAPAAGGGTRTAAASGATPGASPVQETSYLALPRPPTRPAVGGQLRAAPPAASRAAATPNPPARRQAPARRPLPFPLPWPFSRSR